MKGYLKRLIIPCLLLLCCASTVCAQSLSSYDLKGHLQSSSITGIVQDELGFIWIGSDNGLARFDGYAMEPFKLGNDSIFIGYVNALKNHGNSLYIATNEGLYIYDYLKNRTTVATPVLQNENIVSFLQIGTSWLIATNTGLYVFDNNWIQLDKLTEEQGLSNNRITCMQLSRDKELWIGTEQGLDLARFSAGKIEVGNLMSGQRIAQLFFDSHDDVWICRREDVLVGKAEEVKAFKDNALHCLSQDMEVVSFFQYEDQVWVGTRGMGVSQFRIQEGGRPSSVGRFLIEERAPDELKNTTLAFYEDNYSNVWICTLNGLYLYKTDKEHLFTTLRHSHTGTNTPASNIISSIFCDHKGVLWLATSNGINRLEWNTANDYSFRHFPDERDMANKIANNKIQNIIAYREDVLFVSTKSAIKFFDVRGERFFDNEVLNESLQKYGMKYVRSSFRDTENNIWLAFSEGGVGVLNTESGQLQQLNTGRGTHSKHRTICRDRLGKLWLSSDDEGLFCLSFGKSIQDVTGTKLYGREQFDSHWLTSLYIDKQYRIWAGTSNGLYLYDKAADRFAPVDFPYARKSFYVGGIIEDYYGNIWVVGSESIYKISSDGTAQYYEPYSSEDIAKTWYILGLATGKDGTVFVGGVNGLTCFNPLDIVPDPHHHTVYISHVEVMNKAVFPDGKKITEDVNVSEHLVLSYRDYQFSLTFSSLFYPDPMKVGYAYKLEGFDEDWITTDASRRYVSYSNLKPGDYVFLVKSSNASGIWLDNVRKIHITVQRAPWQTVWAYLLYALLLAGIVFLVVKVFNLGSKLRYKEALNQWKLNYYINLSYGFKVPLTLIYAPLQGLLKGYDSLSEAEVKGMLHTMLQNVRKLSSQISQLVEFRKLDSGEIGLCLSETDMVGLCRDVFTIFREEAREKELDYHFDSNVNSVVVTIDAAKMEVTLYNIISNAVKYTPVGGRVVVACHLNSEDYRLWLSVSDTGSGIDRKEQVGLFDRPGRIRDLEKGAKKAPSGIGLSVAAGYIRLHHSEILLDSQPGKGSEFRFFLLLGDSHFTQKEKCSMNSESASSFLPEIPSRDLFPDSKDLPAVEADLPLIYLYEADRDLDLFIKQSLYKEFMVKLMSDDFQWKDFTPLAPTLVLIDLPCEDEKKLAICRAIKSDAYYSNIPVVFISSVSSDEYKQSAYEAGADAYITKPFDILYLKTRIKQALDLRKHIKEKVKKELIVNPKEVIITSDDDVFLANVVNTIEEHISDPDFNIDDLASRLNISRSMFYRRIQQLTKLAPVEFVKKVRMKRAADLLAVSSYNIAEVSYRVGFSDQRYFSSCFKKEYGITPKKYSLMKKGKREND